MQRAGSPRSPGDAALEFCRPRDSALTLPRKKHAIVECQGASTPYHLHPAWTADGIHVERVDRIG